MCPGIWESNVPDVPRARNAFYGSYTSYRSCKFKWKTKRNFFEIVYHFINRIRSIPNNVRILQWKRLSYLSAGETDCGQYWVAYFEYEGRTFTGEYKYLRTRIIMVTNGFGS